MELWQLFDEQGRAITGKGAGKDEIRKGLLHGAAHVWIWRRKGNTAEILLQKRADDKPTWPGLYDISAAGHIDLDESPLDAALREAVEEIGLKIQPEQLSLIGVNRSLLTAGNNIIENEFQWIYLLELKTATRFSMQKSEVTALHWKELNHLINEIFGPENAGYVPHEKHYYELVLSLIGQAAKP